MKILNQGEKKRRRLLREYKSVENKLHGENLIWWNSISMKARYHFIFRWISHKKNTTVRTGLPSNKFKHFLKSHKQMYKTTIHNYRNAVIEHILD